MHGRTKMTALQLALPVRYALDGVAASRGVTLSDLLREILTEAAARALQSGTGHHAA